MQNFGQENRVLQKFENRRVKNGGQEDDKTMLNNPSFLYDESLRTDINSKEKWQVP